MCCIEFTVQVLARCLKKPAPTQGSRAYSVEQCKRLADMPIIP